jgi:amino acid adenylation domain-containing protein
MIGLAINTLPVRVSLGPSASVAEALAELHRRIQDVSHFSYLSLPEIQATSTLPSGEPMFNCLLVFENYPAAGLAGDVELGRSDMTVHEKTSLPLVLIILPGDTPKLVVNYDAALFDADAIERLCGNYVRLIEQIVDTPESGLSELDLLTAAEVSALRKWNATTASFSAEATVTALIEAQARRTPDAVAVRSEAGTLTYRALDEAANRLAHRLHERHVDLCGQPLTPDSVVGLCVERGLGMSVGILGILKAGAAYLPLDPDYPEARLADMVEDANCPLVVCDDDLAAGLPLLTHLAPDRRLSLDDPALVDAPATPPHPIAGPGNLAYVIYTSGSTGRPKGVAIEHRSLVNRLEWMQHAFPIGPDDRILQKTPYSFDVSVWELLWPLLVGASLTFARPEGHKDPAYLVRLIRDGTITTVHFVPSMLQAFFEQPDLESLTGLRRLFCSGEALSTALTSRLLGRLPGLAVHNLYGPTEAAIDVSHHFCGTADVETAAVTPIGRPVWNTTLHVLDLHQHELPVGVPGELHIGGVQLARGYLNRPELTAERFITAPFGVGRLYRTGDLVRRRADGAIDYLGRLDFQVKLRGIRIELGEIEAVLERLPGIRQACVITRPLAADTALVAYYVADQEHDPRELAQALARTLPAAMVPAFFLKLDAFPLTIAGKVDRNRLPTHTIGDRRAADAKEPRNSLEATLVSIFAKVLQIEKIGIEDDFFALGGHSLTATQVVSRLRATLKVELPVKAVFEDRTVAALARRAGEALTRSPPNQEPLPRGEAIGPQPLSFAQERLWFMHRFAGGSPLYNLPTMLRMRGAFDVSAFSVAVNGWIAQHGILRSRIIDNSGEPHQIILPPQELMIAVEPLSPALLDARLAAEATKPFDLANESPVRVRILRLAADDHVVMIVQHHLISDGWSIGLMLSELAERYAAARAGRTMPPIDGPNYFDFARWQRASFRGERLQRSLVYWRNALGGLPTLTLPTDRPRPPAPSYQGATVAFTLGPDVMKGVRRIAFDHGGTTFTVLLTAFKLLLARYSGQSDIVVGTPIANRNRIDLEGIPGLFVNTLVLRTNLEGTGTFTTALRRVTDNALAAYAHQDMPFEVLVEALRPERDPSRSALFQVFFVLQNAHGSAEFEAAGLEVEPLRFDHGTAKFDLTMAFEEIGGRLEGVVEYATDLFDRPTIERLVGHFQNLLASVLAAPAIELSKQGISIFDALPSTATASPGQKRPSQVETQARDHAGRSRALSGRTELRIAEIWRTILGLDEINATDNFFDLGGTSLLVMRVQARLRIDLGIDLPVVALFSKPTVRELAALIDGRDAPVDIRARAQERATRRRRHAERSRDRT